METLKKFEYSLKKIKIMVLRVGKEEVEGIDERVQHDTVLGMDHKRPYTWDGAKMK